MENNKSAPKSHNEFSKISIFQQKWENICQNLKISFKIMFNIGKILTFVSKKTSKMIKIS